MCIENNDCVDLADLPYCDVCGYDADCPACLGEADFDDFASEEDDIYFDA